MTKGEATITFWQGVEDRGGMRALLVAYYKGVLRVFEAAGGPRLEPSAMMSDLDGDKAQFLPPGGCTAVAHDARGALVGCGFMRQCAPGVGELKRLYVAADQRGTGLGRRLVQARIDRARPIGFHRVCADTAKGNTSMLRLYDAMGFAPCERYPGNANDPEYDPYLVYRKLDL